jgi:hypothetical protein
MFAFMQILWIFETHGGHQNEQFCSGPTILPMYISQVWNLTDYNCAVSQKCLGP